MILLMSGWLLWLALLAMGRYARVRGENMCNNSSPEIMSPWPSAILAIGAAITLGRNPIVPTQRGHARVPVDQMGSIEPTDRADWPAVRRRPDYTEAEGMDRGAGNGPADAARPTGVRLVVVENMPVASGHDVWLVAVDSDLCAVLLVQVFAWLIRREQPHAQMSDPLIAMLYFVLTMMPVSTMMGVALKIPMLGYESLMPVERKTYLRQVGAAFALSLLQLWGGISIALGLWWLLAGPRRCNSRCLRA